MVNVGQVGRQWAHVFARRGLVAMTVWFGRLRSKAEPKIRTRLRSSSPYVELIVERPNDSLAQNVNQTAGVASRDVAVLGRLQHARYNFPVAPPNVKFVSNFDSMRGFGRSPVEKHKARVAKLLG